MANPQQRNQIDSLPAPRETGRSLLDDDDIDRTNMPKIEIRAEAMAAGEAWQEKTFGKKRADEGRDEESPLKAKKARRGRKDPVDPAVGVMVNADVAQKALQAGARNKLGGYEFPPVEPKNGKQKEKAVADTDESNGLGNNALLPAPKDSATNMSAYSKEDEAEVAEWYRGGGAASLTNISPSMRELIERSLRNNPIVPGDMNSSGISGGTTARLDPSNPGADPFNAGTRSGLIAAFTNTNYLSNAYMNTNHPSSVYTNTNQPSSAYMNSNHPSSGYTNNHYPSSAYLNLNHPSNVYTNTNQPSSAYINTNQPSSGMNATASGQAGALSNGSQQVLVGFLSQCRLQDANLFLFFQPRSSSQPVTTSSAQDLGVANASSLRVSTIIANTQNDPFGNGYMNGNGAAQPSASTIAVNAQNSSFGHGGNGGNGDAEPSSSTIVVDTQGNGLEDDDENNVIQSIEHDDILSVGEPQQTPSSPEPSSDPNDEDFSLGASKKSKKKARRATATRWTEKKNKAGK